MAGHSMAEVTRKRGKGPQWVAASGTTSRTPESEERQTPSLSVTGE